jgi:hypothetical protein
VFLGVCKGKFLEKGDPSGTRITKGGVSGNNLVRKALDRDGKLFFCAFYMVE